ncbi:hypothetical protein CEXT_209611, partial [Caerostris extrusa]
ATRNQWQMLRQQLSTFRTFGSKTVHRRRLSTLGTTHPSMGCFIGKHKIHGTVHPE